LTLDLKVFPRQSPDDLDIFAHHPDDFVLDLANLDPEIVIAAAKQRRAALQDPPCTLRASVDCVRRQGLVAVAAFLEDEIDLI
jgi:hypothetical protein